ncbi:hypothetical protein IWQ60_010036 [Tieghemiomyces parasiticus]|uniref:Uncharacterized protein n=1 Tax=Tieghemiomyces parasiticus TaxID=78921 RepID=A0A9W7ZMM7_9FUNG|nr:hypothetical protein IWQ60_010036 [Tieghemiomyces parasiticus]
MPAALESGPGAPHQWYTHTSVQIENVHPPRAHRQAYRIRLAGYGHSDHVRRHQGSDVATMDTDDGPSQVRAAGPTRLIFEPLDLGQALPETQDPAAETWTGESRLSGVWPCGDLVPNAFVNWRLMGAGRALELRLVPWLAPATVDDLKATGADQRRLPPAPTSASAAPTQLILHFPANVLPSPAFEVENSRRGLAVWLGLTSGHVLRLTFRAPHLFTGDSLVTVQCLAHPVAGVVQGKRVPVMLHAVDAQRALVSCHDGVTVLLERSGSGALHETELAAAGYLSQVKTLLPFVAGRFFAGGSQAATGITSGGSNVTDGYRVTDHSTEWQSIALTAVRAEDYLDGLASSASHLALPTAAEYFICLCRDRKLRLWSVDRRSCAKVVPLPTLTAAGTLEDPTSPVAKARSVTLLPPTTRRYVQIVPRRLNPHAVAGAFEFLVYVPDEQQPYFALYRAHLDGHDNGLASVDYVAHYLCRGIPTGLSAEAYLGELADFCLTSPASVAAVGSNDGSHRAGRRTSGGHLRSAEAMEAPLLWALWEAAPDPTRRVTLAYCQLAPTAGAPAWHAVLHQPHPDVTNPAGYLDTRLRALDAAHPVPTGVRAPYSDAAYARRLGLVFTNYLLYPGRYAWPALQFALRRYRTAFQGSDQTHNHCQRRPSVSADADGAASGRPPTRYAAGPPSAFRDRLLATVGLFLRVETNVHDGVPAVASYRRQLRTEWMRYLTLCTQLQANLEAPRTLSAVDNAATLDHFAGVVVSRGACVGHLRPADTAEVLRAHLDQPVALGCDLAHIGGPRLALSYPLLADRTRLDPLLETLVAMRTVVELVPAESVHAVMEAVASWTRVFPTAEVPSNLPTRWYEEHIAPALRGTPDEASLRRQLTHSFRADQLGWKRGWVLILGLAVADLTPNAVPGHANATGGDGPVHRPGAHLAALLAAAYQAGVTTGRQFLRDLLITSVVLAGTHAWTRADLGDMPFDQLNAAGAGYAGVSALLAESGSATTLNQRTGAFSFSVLARLVYRHALADWLAGQSFAAADTRALDLLPTVGDVLTSEEEDAASAERTLWITGEDSDEDRDSLTTTTGRGRDSTSAVDRVATTLSSLEVRDTPAPTTTVAAARLTTIRPPLATPHFRARGLPDPVPGDALPAYSLSDAIVATLAPSLLLYFVPGQRLPAQLSPAGVDGSSGLRCGPGATLAALTTLGPRALHQRLGLTEAVGRPTDAGATFPTPLVQLVYQLAAADCYRLAHHLLARSPTTYAVQFLWGHVYLRRGLFANAYRCLVYAAAGLTTGSAEPLWSLLPAQVVTVVDYYVMCADLMEAQQQPAYSTKLCRRALAALPSPLPEVNDARDEDETMPAQDNEDETLTKAPRLYFRIFHSTLQCREYEAAYQAMLAIEGDPTTQGDCLRHLIAVLCEADLVHLVIRWPFGHLQEEVELTLLFKARNSEVNAALVRSSKAGGKATDADHGGESDEESGATGRRRGGDTSAGQADAYGSTGPRYVPNFYKILYAYHVYRGDYRNAASVMYQYGQRVANIRSTDPKVNIECLVEQSMAQLSAAQTLALVDSADAWVIVPPPAAHPLPHPHDRQIKKRRVEPVGSGLLTGDDDAAAADRHGPPTGTGGRDASAATTAVVVVPDFGRQLDIVTLVDLRREYQLCLAKLKIAERIPVLMCTPDPLTPADVLQLFAQCGLYDEALSFARLVEADLAPTLRHLAHRCVDLSRAQADGIDAARLLASGEWWTSDLVADAEGPPDARAWKLLQMYLDRHDPAERPANHGRGACMTDVVTTYNPITDAPGLPILPHSLRAAVLDQVLGAGGAPPPWLTQPLLIDHPDTLVRLHFKHGYLIEATRYAVQHLRRAESLLKRVPINHATMRWAPLSLYDELRAANDRALATAAADGTNNSNAAIGAGGAQDWITMGCGNDEECEAAGFMLTLSPVERRGLVQWNSQFEVELQRYFARLERETEECLAQA